MAIRLITAFICILSLASCSDESKFVGTWELTSVYDGMMRMPDDTRGLIESGSEDAEYYAAMESLQEMFEGTISLEIKRGGTMVVDLMGSKYQASYAVRERSINLLMQDTPVGEFWMGSINQHGQLEASSQTMGLFFVFTKQGR